MLHVDLHDSLDDVPPLGAVEVGECPKSGDIIPFAGGHYEVIMVFAPYEDDAPDMQGIAAIVVRVD